MDELWGLLLIFFIAIFALPIIILVKISSVSSRMKGIEDELRRLNSTRQKTVREEAKTEPERKPEPVVKPAPIPESVITATAEEKDEILAEVNLEETKIPETTKVDESDIAYAALEAEEKSDIPVFSMFSEEKTSAPRRTPAPRESVYVKPEREKKETTSIRFENLLSKIGIVTLVLGVAFFVKYAIDKDWINEVGRVAIGVLTGGILIGIAHKLRTKYDLFSALMVGGGISVLYITITLAFREYHLFSQTLAFIILIAITLFSVVLSLVYNRKELALFSLLGGYASPLMISTGEGNYIVLFSFLLILNSGMLLISMRKKWGIIGIVSFACTLLFYWVWLNSTFENQYAGALVFAILFFVQFYLLALFDHFLSGKQIAPFQVGVILANNLSLFAASIYIFSETEFKVYGLITIAMAVVNALVMLFLFRKATVDKRLIYLIIAIVLSFVSLSIPVQLNGHVITMFWAAEIVILLWLWHKSGIKVFFVGFILISFLTLGSYLMDVSGNYLDSFVVLPVIFNRMFVTGLVMIAAFVISKRILAQIKPEQAKSVADLGVMGRVMTWIIFILTYLVPFLELNYQFSTSAMPDVCRFTATVLYVYTIIYVAVLCAIFRKKIPQTKWAFVSLYVTVALYLMTALPEMIDFRWGIYNKDRSAGLFLIHYLSLPALAYIFYMLAKSIRKLSKQAYTIGGWILVAFAVVILSVELDNIVVQLFATKENYSGLLYDVHTFGYPILWGILAMILMIWGLKAKEALLRQISLGFFAFIIAKFYVSDIWMMSQTGRIISFVALGVILLLVSFLIQKIKVLIKDDGEEPVEQTKHKLSDE